MKKSKEDGDAERELWGKYKCYCDTTEGSKILEVKKLTEEIATLEGKLEETKASTGLLSQQTAQLKADLATNKEVVKEAEDMHEKEMEELESKEKELEQVISQLKKALEVIAEVGADQTAQSSADHEQYLKGNTKPELVQILKEAQLLASAKMTNKQKDAFTAFVQAPFTGTYSAQSGEIVGILKNMRDTFQADLEATQSQMKTSKKAHKEYMNTLEAEAKAMKAASSTKQGTLGTNDNSVATLQEQLEEAKKTKAEAEAFSSSLIEKCNAKEEQYKKRVELRVAEEASIAEAVRILDSDEAFATFGGTRSGTTGNPKQDAKLIAIKTTTKTKSKGFLAMPPTSPTQSFFQESSVRRHLPLSFVQLARQAVSAPASPRAFLQQQMGEAGGSKLLSRISTLLSAGTPFDTVLEEIKKMLDLIETEEKADADQKAWCEKERSDTGATIEKKQTDIDTLESDIAKLTADVEDPTIGLMVQIKGSEDDLRGCIKDQKEETKTRREENVEYQKEIANLVQAEDLVGKAVRVLKKYYDKLAEEQASSLLQAEARAMGRVAEPPATWEDEYTGQSSDGNSVVSQLEFLLKNTKTEETLAHETEMKAQHSFEDEMDKLKDLEAKTQDSLSKLRVSLAEKQKTLREKNKDLEATKDEKKAAEAYLVDIKPGCDFIMGNIAMRTYNREKETDALTKAASMIKDTPAYKSAMLDKHIQGLGDCADVCQEEGEEKAGCKACLAGVSVPGYCASHPSTKGC